jgi:hypothetical protein
VCRPAPHTPASLIDRVSDQDDESMEMREGGVIEREYVELKCGPEQYKEGKILRGDAGNREGCRRRLQGMPSCSANTFCNMVEADC